MDSQIACILSPSSSEVQQHDDDDIYMRPPALLPSYISEDINPSRIYRSDEFMPNLSRVLTDEGQQMIEIYSIAGQHNQEKHGLVL